jgi:hypothetical protein
VSRKKPNLTTCLASALAELQWRRGDGFAWGDLKQMTAEQLCSLYQWDHSVYAAWGGGEHFTNLTPRLTHAHKIKTRKVDIPTIAKAKRIAGRQAERLIPVDVTGARDDGHNAPRPTLKRKWPKRPFPKRQKDKR